LLYYLKCKLSAQDKREIQSLIDDISYTCGTTLQELDLPEKMMCIYVKEHNCFDPVEKLCYSLIPSEFIVLLRMLKIVIIFYPKCSTCSDKLSVKKRS